MGFVSLEKSNVQMHSGLRHSIASLLPVLLLLCVLGTAEVASYTPKDKYLIACGSGSPVASDADDRSWVGDAAPTSSFLEKNPQSVAASTEIQSSNLPSAVPFLKGRIFTSPGSYSFSVTPGQHWLRLYFYPFPFKGFDLNNAILSVKVDSYTLINNMNITRELQARNFFYVRKEFSINMTSSPVLISFIPGNAKGAFAMVNGIELVSMPGNLLEDNVMDVDVGLSIPFGISSTATETVYRLNVGGQAVTAAGDELSRAWDTDIAFIPSAATGVQVSTGHSISYGSLDNYTAPSTVYQTARTMTNFDALNLNYNLTWSFMVDPGFHYYIRLHFCEFEYSLVNQRVFDIYINGLMGFESFDVIAKSNAEYSPVYLDFVTSFPTDQAWSSSNIVVALHPNNASASYKFNSILNGLEIFKMNDSDGNLQGPLPPLLFVPDGSASLQISHHSQSSHTKQVVGGVTGALAALVLIAGVGLFCRHSRKKPLGSPAQAWLPLPIHGGNSQSIASKLSTASPKSGTGSYTSTQSDLNRLFTFVEILDITSNFDESRVVGVGGFGKVYYGLLDDGTKVAVKRGNSASDQGATEFYTEIEMLSQLRHRHLVSLIGFCKERGEMILVYDYMANGPLRGHLYGTKLPPLSWKQRLEICIGAAKGLHYLHTGAAHGIIHRDVKSTNILLDENFVAKVSDFGLCKTGATLDNTHVSTAVKGSFGYLDPEYFRRQQLTEKSDVYSFGVVLVEVLCTRPVINPALPREQVNMAEWALKCHKAGKLDQIIDPYLANKSSQESLKMFWDTAEKCLSDRGSDRPTMGNVLWYLEYALRLYQSSVDEALESSTPQVLEMNLCVPEGLGLDNSEAKSSKSIETTGSTCHLLSQNSEDGSIDVVFSNPVGR